MPLSFLDLDAPWDVVVNKRKAKAQILSRILPSKHREGGKTLLLGEGTGPWRRKTQGDGQIRRKVKENSYESETKACRGESAI